MLVAISSWSPAARNGLFLCCYRSFNKHLLRSQGIFLNGDLPGCSINGDALAGGDALCGSCDSDDCRDTILAGHDTAVRDGPAHFHDQPASREEEGGPAGIGGGSDQDFTGGQMRTRWIEDNARLRCHCSWRCRRPPQHALRLASSFRRNSTGFGAVGEQHSRDMAAAHFEVAGCAVSADYVMAVFTCQLCHS